MAINYELLNKGGISLGTNFELLSEKPLDSRLVVPSLEGLQNYIDNAAAYEGMIAYVTSEKKHYEVKVIDGVLSYRPFGLTEAELNDLITNATTAAMEFKGATATLPEAPAKGDMYKVAGENINITIDNVPAKLGDSIVYDGAQWFLIPSGDDIEDTWRPVEGVNNDATLKFVDGDKVDAVVAADGTVKFNHEKLAAAPSDVTTEGDEKTRTYLTAVEVDEYGHVTGYKTATENVEDTNTTYEFESQAETSNVYFNVTSSEEGAQEETIYLDAYSKNETDGKYKAKQATVDSGEKETNKFIAKVTQNENGEVTVEKAEVDFSGLASVYQPIGSYKTIQEAIAAVETDANVFVDTVAQDENGVITITTKAVDFSNYQEKGDYKTIQQAINAIATEKNVFIDTIAQNANGVITITTKAVDFSELDAKYQPIGNYQAAGDYKTKQDAYESNATDANVFIERVKQNANGEIYEVVTKAVDFSGVEAKVKEVDDKLANHKTKQTAVTAGGEANKVIKGFKQNENGEITDVETTEVDFSSLATVYEPIGAENRAKAYVDGKFTDANLAQYTTEQEVKDIVDGVIKSAADSDTYDSLTKLIDYIDAHGGEATEMAGAIDTLEGKVKTLEEAPSAGIKATDIETWNGEIGAKELAASKTTATEVKAQIEAYGYATTSNVGTAKEEAIAAAKTETENQVKALGDTVYSKEQTFTKDEVNAAIEAAVAQAHTWGSF